MWNKECVKQPKLDQHFMRIAFLTAHNLSKDPRTKVGAVIVTPDGRQLSTGYNGFPAGAEELPQHWETEEKYERVIHAEENAIINAPFDTKGCTLYCTLQPCYKCLGRIINAGIKRVVYYYPARERDPRQDIVAEWKQLVQFDQLDPDVDPDLFMLWISGGLS
jgi:dCMP deaminase